MTLNTYQLRLATRAAQHLKERVILEYGNDADLIKDTIEGETDLDRLMGFCTLELAALEGEKEGIEIAINKLKARLTRHDNQAQALRHGLHAAMEALEVTSFKTPAATLSVRPSPPRVIITDQSALPTEVLIFPEPVPDKRAISSMLKNGFEMRGAELSNSPPALSVRFS